MLTIGVLLAASIIAGFAGTVLASEPPKLPHAFSGDLTIYGPSGSVLAPIGTEVVAKVGGEVRGRLTTIGEVAYGDIDDIEVPDLYVGEENYIDEGDTIEFYANGIKADQTATFESGANTKLDLTVHDTVAPVVTIDSVTTPTNVDTQTITGTFDEAFIDTIVVNGVTATIDEDAGTYSAADVPLEEGTNTITVTATDLVGNAGTATATYTFKTEAAAPPPVNQPPTADAGGPYSVDEGETVELDGTGSSDPDGDALTYSWTITDDPTGEASLTDADTSTPTFHAPSVDSDTDVTVELTVDDGHGHTDSDTATVTVKAVAPPPPPARFELSNLVISPAAVLAGDTVTISVVVTNVGDLSGDYAVTLRIDGATEATQTVTVDAGASETVIFTVVRTEARAYDVEVNGLFGSFTVSAPPPTAWLVLVLAIIAIIPVVLILWKKLKR